MTTLKANNFHLIDDLEISTLSYNLIKRIEATYMFVTSQVNLWVSRAKDRQALAQMSEQMLNDIGLSRSQVNIEAGKNFWQR